MNSEQHASEQNGTLFEQELIRELVEALKAQHQAIDMLFVLLIAADTNFHPTAPGPIWDACVQSNDAMSSALAAGYREGAS